MVSRFADPAEDFLHTTRAAERAERSEASEAAVDEPTDKLGDMFCCSRAFALLGVTAGMRFVVT